MKRETKTPDKGFGKGDFLGVGKVGLLALLQMTRVVRAARPVMLPVSTRGNQGLFVGFARRRNLV